MSYIKQTDRHTGEEVHLYYEDLGAGQPMIFIHGWPLSQEMWEYQVGELVQQGIRCITYDRRGFGKSSKPLGGYDYDTLADDLSAVIKQLSLTDVVLVGFSMGGGEVARYFTRHGGARVSKVVFISSVTPFMLKTSDNEDGLDQTAFDETAEGLRNDRIAFLDSFGKQFFGVTMLNHPVSQPLLDYYRTLASLASPIATNKCAVAFSQTDFRSDFANIKVPALIIHGDSDKIVPHKTGGDKTAALLPNDPYILYSEAPHGLFYTHRQQLNNDLLRFANNEVLAEAPGVVDYATLQSNF